MRTGILLLLCGCAAQDADFDGFPDGEDCDDSDPFTYPGAPDDPADGADSDCDGIDPDHAFVGTWALDSLVALYSSFSFLVEDASSGELTIGPEMDAQIQLSSTINPDLTDGLAYPIELTMDGDASPLDGPGLVEIYLSGTALGEDVELSLGCAVTDAQVLTCDGALLIYGTSLDTSADFSAP